MVVGGIIGSGIFFTPAETARALPSAGLVFLVWAVGGVVALAGALTYAELGAMMPDAGGAYVYIREGFGRLPAFLYGWMALLSIGTGALAAVALGFAGYAGRFVDLTPFGGQIGVAAATILVLTLTNYFGIKPGAMLQNVLAVAKIAALAALILGGFALWTKLGAPPLVAKRAGGGIRGRVVHDRRVAADEHGRGRDSRPRTDDPTRTGVRHRHRDRHLPRRERRLSSRVRP